MINVNNCHVFINESETHLGSSDLQSGLKLGFHTSYKLCNILFCINNISKSLQTLTCDQVGQCPHGALQLCGRSWVPFHILRVPLIITRHFIDVLLKVRHFRFNLLHTDKHTLHLASVFTICQLM